jgi:hypothetical protein
MPAYPGVKDVGKRTYNREATEKSERVLDILGDFEEASKSTRIKCNRQFWM